MICPACSSRNVGEHGEPPVVDRWCRDCGATWPVRKKVHAQHD